MSKILVIGDSCKDIHIYGRCERLCPDAPVPVFVPNYEKQNRGMAGNVYQNVVALGETAVLKTNNIVVEKKRFVEEKTNHMFLRVDSGEENVKRINSLTSGFLSRFELIIISDYNKGFLHEEDIKFICQNHNLVFIDTKKQIGDFCKECSYIKINETEFNNSRRYIENNAWSKQKTIITLGNKGCSFEDKIYPVDNVEIKDLCGAGDTFISALCVKYLETKNIEKSIIFANSCATKVVQMKGVNTL
jgi:D-beta-D-heptose 7-phosphate kinase/D-beta-D-heptose 1-phosphate adenosyltransferase